jgi:transcriptional regulator with XRE-family HTH domain
MVEIKIGEKIKSIRNMKMMTQKQLAGERITRNMLSRIENGAALPSLDTVFYLAGRLNVSPGYLLSEGEDEMLFRKIYKIENIRRAYKNGDFRICMDICRAPGLEDDDEIKLIMSRCSSEIAKEEFCAGRLRSAAKAFEEAVEYAEKGVYNDDTARAEAVVYFRYMKRISQTLGGELSGRAVSEGLAYGDSFCVYVAALEALENGKAAPDDKISLLLNRGEDSPLYAHIKAREAMKTNNFPDAAKLLRSILTSQNTVPDPFLFTVFYDLEICSKEINDYRGAYEYAADKVNLLERMLSEADD